MNAARISRPSSVRIGMFCRFGFDDDSRPVAAPAWLKLVWMRPERTSISSGSASTYVPFSLLICRYSSTLRTTSCSGARSSSTTAAVEIGAQLFVKLKRIVGMLLGRGAELQIEAAVGQLAQGATHRICVEQKRVKHHVVLKASAVDAQSRQGQQHGFQVAADLGP